MKRSVVVYGPQGCGKTRHGVALMKHFGMQVLIERESWPDGEELPQWDALILTNRSFDELPIGIEAVAFVAAMARLAATSRPSEAAVDQADAPATPTREAIWVQAWCATANAANCTSLDSPTKWADRCLADFDRRFGDSAKARTR